MKPSKISMKPSKVLGIGATNVIARRIKDKVESFSRQTLDRGTRFNGLSRFGLGGSGRLGFPKPTHGIRFPKIGRGRRIR